MRPSLKWLVGCGCLNSCHKQEKVYFQKWASPIFFMCMVGFFLKEAESPNSVLSHSLVHSFTARSGVGRKLRFQTLTYEPWLFSVIIKVQSSTVFFFHLYNVKHCIVELLAQSSVHAMDTTFFVSLWEFLRALYTVVDTFHTLTLTEFEHSYNIAQ